MNTAIKHFTACLSFLALAVAVPHTVAPHPALAQPAVNPDPNADIKAFEEVQRKVQALTNDNPQQAAAEWQQFLAARPNLIARVDYKVADLLALLQIERLNDPAAALATYDAGIKRHPDAPGTLVLVMNKGRLLMRLGRLDEAEAAMRPYWQRALDLYTSDPGLAQTFSRQLMQRYVSALQRQGKTDEIIERLRLALVATPALGLAQSFGQDWIYDELVNQLVTKKDYEEALAFAKLRFMIADYNWKDMGAAVNALRQVWTAKEGAESPSLKAFMTAQEDPKAVNPLRAARLPVLTPQQKAAWAAWRGYPNDVANGMILSGAFNEALRFSFNRSVANTVEPYILYAFSRIMKAEDLNTRRANEIITYLQMGAGTNPLVSVLEQLNALPPAPENAAPEADDMKAFDELKAGLAEKKADANAMIAAYTKFYEDRPALHTRVAIRLTDEVVRLYEQINFAEKAQQVNWWGWGKFKAHPDALRLLVNDHRLHGRDPLPSILNLQNLSQRPPTATGVAPIANAGRPPAATGNTAPAGGREPFGGFTPTVQNPPTTTTAVAGGVVTNTNDSGPGSFRQALLHAGANPGTTIRFNIPNTDVNFKDGVFTIAPESPLPAVKGAGTVIDGGTQTAFTGDTNKAGPEVVLQSKPGTRGRHGLYLNSPNCIIKSLIINSTPGNAYRFGILINGPGATGNKVQACYIGTNTNGTEAMGCIFGIQMEQGANGNTIGGTTPDARNIIAGNGSQVSFYHTGTSGNIVQGNYLGTNVDGDKVFPQSNAVMIEEGASNNLIGGDTKGAGNLIGSSGEQASGVRIASRGSNGNIIQGNLIGTDKTGSRAITSCGFGILVLNGVENTQIGGTKPEAGNLIVGGVEAGIQFSFNRKNVAQNNYIGCDITGKKVLGNGVGVLIYASAENIVGGAAGSGNVIGGSEKDGIFILGEDEPVPASKNIVQGNSIGVAADGKTPLPNGGAGVKIAGIAHQNIIGQSEDGLGSGNVIAFNKGRNVVIEGDEKNKPTGTVIKGNASHDNGA